MSRRLSDLITYHATASQQLQPIKGAGSGKSSGIPLGIRLDALGYSAGIDGSLEILESWERLWREELNLVSYGLASSARNDGTPLVTLTGIVKFLQSHLDQACIKFAFIDEFNNELQTVHAQAQRAAGEQIETAWRVTCPADTDQGECGTRLRLTGADMGGSITCKSCKTNWSVERLLMVVISSNQSELWVDWEAATNWYGISHSTLKRWARSGKIHRQGQRYELHSIRQAIATA
jgi:hypothetical protein